VSHRFTCLRFVLRPLGDLFIFLTLTRLVVVFIFVNFSFTLFTPPLGDYHRVNLDGHHRGMEYLGSTILMAVVPSFLFVLADSPKIIGPSLFSCMTTSVVPILMVSFFVILSIVVGICPLPDWSAFAAE
jgi:hypothetical protein